MPSVHRCAAIMQGTKGFTPQLVLVLLVASTWGAPHLGEQDHLATILSYHHTDDGDGHFQYGFKSSNGINVQAEGTPGIEGQNIRGTFRYPLPDGTIVDVHYVADENGYRVEYPIIHSLRPLPARPDDTHEHDDPLQDPAEESTDSSHIEDDLPDSHVEDHNHLDAHMDYNVTDSHTPTNPHTPSHSLTQHDPYTSHVHTPTDSHTPPDSHTPSDSHSATNHTLESPQDSPNSLTLDLRSVG
ncbi:pupal cuticle protein-like isoform X1 [Scylla paramamosain]|uniref:pupal cuticle protein-like isoform X1 n=1 Tax=Scylla paramamosain TaxID=85552 RepID=UPI0030830F23